MQKGLSKKSKNNIGVSVRVLGDLLEKSTQHVRHLDTQANILIGISSAIFVFAVSNLATGVNNLSLVALASFAALTAIAGLFAVHPPRVLRRQGRNESLFYNHRIREFKTAKAYEKEMQKMFGNKKNIVRQYTSEVYHIYKNLYAPKRRLFNIGRNLLVLGLVFGFILFIFDTTL